MHSNQTGKLEVGRQVRSGGKIVDEWRYVSPFKRKDIPEMLAKISIDKGSEAGITFVARSEALPEPISDTDINRLKEKVETAFCHQHNLLTNVTWEDWLEIEVRGSNETRRGETRNDLHIIYRKLKRCVDPETGEAYTVSFNNVAIPFPKPKRSGTREPGNVDYSQHPMLKDFKGMDARDEECEYSYLPATDENIAALEEIMRRMRVLRSSLTIFLGQGNVQQALAGLASGAPALPAPL